MPPNGLGDSLLFLFMHLPLKPYPTSFAKSLKQSFSFSSKKREEIHKVVLFMLISS